MLVVTVMKVTLILGLLYQKTDASPDSIFPSPKVWWASWITPDLYTAGRLTEAQIKFASEVGFKTIIALPNFTAPSSLGDEHIPTTDKTKDIATRLADMQFRLVLQPGENAYTTEAVQRFGENFQTVPKPVLFHCGSGYSASFVALSYLANVSRYDQDSIPGIDIDEFFRRAALLGYDYTSNVQAREVIQNITGQVIPVNVTKHDTSLATWRRLWELKPLIKDWFIAGQIQSNHLELMKAIGIKTVVNVRRGVTFGGSPSQEEISLLNIHDNTGTYKQGGRQSQARLEATRIDPNKTNEYISVNSTRNYASRNGLAYGDDVGYNETLERVAVDGLDGVAYVHAPVGGSLRYSNETWEQHKDKLLTAGRTGPVVVHCRSATRASVYALLASGLENGMNSTWAIERAAEMGFWYSDSYKEDIFGLFRLVLDGTSA